MSSSSSTQQHEQQQQQAWLLEEDPEYAEFQRQQANTSSCAKLSRLCALYGCVSLALFFTLSVLLIKLYFFASVQHGPPMVYNGTAVEPNTGTAFSLHFDPKFPGARMQSLIGVDAWVYRIPVPTNPKLLIGSLGYYVERIEAKRRLARFISHNITEANIDHVIETLLERTGLSQTLRIVLRGMPPAGRVMQWWEQNTRELRALYCGDARGEQEFSTFAEQFGSRRFKSGDDLWFERRGEEGALFVRFEGKETKRAGNACFARALFEAHLIAQRLGLFNLVQELVKPPA